MNTFKSFLELGQFFQIEEEEKITLTRSQERAMYCIQAGYNTFINGVAGTGKTWLLKNLQDLTGKPVLLYATSGMTSINLGGVTVSSHEALGLYGYEETRESIKAHNEKGRFSDDVIIVIDEIGFLSTEQFDQIDYALRCIGDEEEFLGGFQVILAGDFRQMPPMHWGTTLEGSSLLKDNFESVELIECVRQKDDIPFFNQLMKVRTEGITASVEKFLESNHRYTPVTGPVITATRSLMDELNAQIPVPKISYDFSCSIKDEGRLYDNVKLWVGMPVIICANNSREGYANGDMGIVTDYIIGDIESNDWDEQDNKIEVLLDRTGTTVLVKEAVARYYYHEDEEKKFFVKMKDGIWSYLPFEEKENSERKWLPFSQEINFSKKKGIQKKIVNVRKRSGYMYMPILPAYYLSIRRVQGLTMQSGVLHESILHAQRYSKDFINIQYVALSRFEKISQCHVEGLNNFNLISKTA